MMAPRACILGCLAPSLSKEEKAYFRDADPWGFILFGRNIEYPDQLYALTSELREALGRDAPILIDQEGGRVARMQSPHWREFLPALDFVKAAGRNSVAAMKLRGRLIAEDLRSVGLDVNCAPVLDVATDETHPILFNRCYGREPDQVAEHGRAVAEGQSEGGVLSVMKHTPGHGRASLDSHQDLPRLSTPLENLQAVDFKPFSALSDLPMAMTAHVVYEALDPENCATLSPTVIDMIRNEIGFQGLLMTDDLSMKALGGRFQDRVTTALKAGCDMALHCNGERAEMDPVLSAVPELSGQAADRANAALALRQAPVPFDVKETERTLAFYLQEAGNV